jgi:hypothetical protein
LLYFSSCHLASSSRKASLPSRKASLPSRKEATWTYIYSSTSHTLLTCLFSCLFPPPFHKLEKGWYLFYSLSPSSLFFLCFDSPGWLELTSSCLSLPRAGNTGLHHYTWLSLLLKPQLIIFTEMTN